MENELNATIEWLLNGESWVRHKTLIYLLDKTKYSPEVKAANDGMLWDLNIDILLKDIQQWDSTVLKRHNDASHPIHKICFLAEICMQAEEPHIETCLKKIANHISDEEPFLTLSNYPKHFGSSGKNKWFWVLCDAP